MAVQRIVPGLFAGTGVDETSPRKTILANSAGVDETSGTPPPPPTGSNISRQVRLLRARRPKRPKFRARMPIFVVVATFLGKPKVKLRKNIAKKRRITRREYPLFRKHPGRRRTFFFD